jgi:predicted aspartyl protease
VAGQVLDTVAIVERFGFADFTPSKVEFMLHPERDMTGSFRGEFAGTMAPNMLRSYDIEIDFAAAKLNLFKPSKCVQSAYWSRGHSAALRMETDRGGHILFPMLLDGKRVRAALDTGMSTTTLDLETARREFGVDTSASHVDNVGSLTGDHRGTIYNVTLRSLATEDGQINVSNPRLNLMPDLTSVVSSDRPQLILGLSTLKRLHVYIAYTRGMLFLTAASGPPAITWQLPEEHVPNSLDRPPQEGSPQVPVPPRRPARDPSSNSTRPN